MNKQHEESFDKHLAKGGLPCIDVKIRDRHLVFLIDSGSDISYIDSNIAEDLELPIIEGMTTVVTSIGSQTPESVTYQANIELSQATLNANVTGIELRATTNHLILPFDGILGVDMLSQMGAEISFSQNKLIY